MKIWKFDHKPWISTAHFILKFCLYQRRLERIGCKLHLERRHYKLVFITRAFFQLTANRSTSVKTSHYFRFEFDA